MKFYELFVLGKGKTLTKGNESGKKKEDQNYRIKFDDMKKMFKIVFFGYNWCMLILYLYKGSMLS